MKINKNKSSIGLQRRDFLQMMGLGTAALVFGSSCKKESNSGLLPDPSTSNSVGAGGKVIWACSASELPGVESEIQANGGGADFHFGGARIYMSMEDSGVHDGTENDWNDDRLLSPLIQGSSGYTYIPTVSMKCLSYPKAWNGECDSYWKSQLDSYEKHWGSKDIPVNGPWGLGAYPIIMSFQHEWTNNKKAGTAYDPTFTELTQPQQYAKAMRYLVEFQRSYKPGLNILWTWIPMAYDFWSHAGANRPPGTDWWPSRITGDNSEPDFSNTDYVDIVGCDGYMSDANFKNIFDKDGDKSSHSVVGFARSVGKSNSVTGLPQGLPWMIGEWGVDEKFGDPNWKKDTLNDMMIQISTSYKDLVYLAMWPNATDKNDNRWNSGPKINNTPTGLGAVNSQGISAKTFASICATGLPGGRPDIFKLLT